MNAALVTKQESLMEHFFYQNRQLLLECAELSRVHSKAAPVQF